MKLGIVLIILFGGHLLLFLASTIAGYGYIWGLSAYFWFFADILLLLYGIRRVVRARRRKVTQ